MNKNSKIYVAGHTGLVGSWLIKKLKEKGYNNFILKTHAELDLRRQQDTEEFFKREKPDYVFLAASKVGGILANSIYVAEFIYDNIMIAVNVINSSYKYGVRKLINFGSSCIYPKFAPQPMREEYILTDTLEPTNEPYAIAKISAIKLCRYYNQQYKTNFISVMPTNLYGPCDNFNLETAHVLPALIRKFHLGKLLMEGKEEEIVRDFRRYPLGFGLDGKVDFSNKENIKKILKKARINDKSLTVWGSGEVYREFLYVEDLAEACIYIMKNIDADKMRKINPDYFLNIGTGVDIKLKDLFYLIKEIVGYKGNIEYDLSKPDGMPRKLLDINRIYKFGWKAKVSLEEGIKRTYSWYLQRINNV